MRLTLLGPKSLFRLALLVSLPSIFMFIYIFTQPLTTYHETRQLVRPEDGLTYAERQIRRQLLPELSDYELGVTNALSDIDYYAVKSNGTGREGSEGSSAEVLSAEGDEPLEPFFNMPALELPTDISLLPNKPNPEELERYLLRNFQANKARGLSDFSLRVTEEDIEEGTLELPELIPNLNVPCWVEEVPKDFTYKDNIYHCHINNRRIKQGFDRMFASYQLRQHYSGFKWRLRCLPSFYLIGVAKCGTTDLFEALTRHPQVLKPDLKEPEFWPYLRFGLNDLILNTTCAKDKQRATFAEYMDTYDLTSEMVKESIRRDQSGSMSAKVFFGDYSTHTFIDMVGSYGQDLEPEKINAHHIHSLWPKSKFILILRDPIDRSYSRYKMRMSRQMGGVPGSAQDFHKRVMKQVQTTNDCFNQHTRRYCVYNAKYGLGQMGTNALLNSGIYSIYLRDWLSVFPLEQILIVKFEDYIQDRITTMHRIIDFLGLDPISGPVRDIINDMTVMNAGPAYDAILPETRAALQQFYRPYNREVADLLGDDRFLWGY